MGLRSGWVPVVLSVITRLAPSWKRWLSAALGILQIKPTPAAVQAWNLTHCTYTCRDPKAAHRGVKFHTEALPIPMCSCFSPAGLEETEKTKKAFCSLAAGIHDPQTFATCLYVDFHFCMFMFSSVYSIALWFFFLRNSLGNMFICFCLFNTTLIQYLFITESQVMMSRPFYNLVVSQPNGWSIFETSIDIARVQVQNGEQSYL